MKKNNINLASTLFEMNELMSSIMMDFSGWYVERYLSRKTKVTGCGLKGKHFIIFLFEVEKGYHTSWVIPRESLKNYMKMWLTIRGDKCT